MHQPDRDAIRRVLAEADGFAFDCLEPHDYQRHVDALLALPAASAVVSPPTDRAAAPTDEDFLVSVEEALEGVLLPDPGFQVLETARGAVLAALGPLVARLRLDRDLAIAHDRQPYPTAWAYEQACKALRKHQGRAEQLAAVLREVLDTFTPMHDKHDGPVTYYDGFAGIEPEQFDRWKAALDVEAHGAGAQQQPDTDPLTLLTAPALLATIKELRDLRAPLIAALATVYRSMTSFTGDEWAMEWLGEVWTQIPLDVRALAGDRNAADELAAPVAQQPAAAQTDEERADREATERDHARGDHTYCGITCEIEMPTEHLRNFVIAKGYPGTRGALDELLRRARAAEQQPAAADDEETPFVPPAHYVRDDGVECCVHTIPVGPNSCAECRELADA
ncbi:hypothetical protein AQI95_24775 [Streptomyces yokosukanensis]|uniref:Uncharacterized protein n=1 Tax=Streptomyces yokosukanensis TaxID=67386 RepID=A0A124HFA0_9ACTN|nr:hypothetical protein [Streptomyces yokosukanensis]KUN03174.1 hypothetical protein AQI95_24775 [Streptomyces yokosukanensis]